MAIKVGDIVYARDAMAGHFFGTLKEYDRGERLIIIDTPWILQDFNNYTTFFTLLSTGTRTADMNFRKACDEVHLFAVTHIERWPHPLPDST